MFIGVVELFLDFFCNFVFFLKDDMVEGDFILVDMDIDYVFIKGKGKVVVIIFEEKKVIL